MVLGTRDLTEQEFNAWKAAHHDAAISLENREEKLDKVYNQIEKDLDLLGKFLKANFIQFNDLTKYFALFFQVLLQLKTNYKTACLVL